MKTTLLSLLSIALAGPALAEDSLRAQARQLFGPLEAPRPATLATPEVALGRALFWDPRVSHDGKTACASCHAAEDHGADRRRFSPDARAKPTSRHSPTVFNSMGQPSMRWLGDRKTGAEQAEGSLTGSLGFASKDDGVRRLAELDYAALFMAAYPN